MGKYPHEFLAHTARLPGDAVLDLCAAPGGKAGQLAAMLQGLGVLVANEPDARRAPLSKEEAEAFVRGEPLALPGEDGYALAAYEDLPLGWGKRSGGILKNHVPKGVRL